ncbi:hypothetical protein SRHO_G00073960 [Serrasalmus rhombeus]
MAGPWVRLVLILIREFGPPISGSQKVTEFWRVLVSVLPVKHEPTAQLIGQAFMRQGVLEHGKLELDRDQRALLQQMLMVDTANRGAELNIPPPKDDEGGAGGYGYCRCCLFW